jgi:hypothetical protein
MSRHLDAACGRSVARSWIEASHSDDAGMTLRCNISRPSSASRHDGVTGGSMDIVAIVMLGSIALWFSQQFDSAQG